MSMEIARRTAQLKAALEAADVPIDWYTARALARINAEYFLGCCVSAQAAEADALRTTQRELRHVAGELARGDK